MRFDLVSDIAVDLEYAKHNLRNGAEIARNKLLHPSERMDKIAAGHEANRFLDNTHLGVYAPAGPWVLAEQAAHKKMGTDLTLSQAAESILASHDTWASAAAEIHRTVRTAELRLEAAKSSREIHAIIADIVWPKGSST